MALGQHNTPLYQVDFAAQAAGKTFGSSKRKIRFRFGYANAEALAQGGVGVECRGEEHEVLCVWSVTSGKKTVLLDGKEVHHSVPKSGGFQGKMECNFSFGKHHIMKLVAHAAPPAGTMNGFEQRQFDLFLDGLSFFEFSKLYELGREKKVIGRNEIRALVTASETHHTANNEYKNYSLPLPSPHSIEAFREDYDTQAPSFAKPAVAPSPPRVSAAVSVHEVSESNKAPEPELIDFFSEPVPTTVQVPLSVMTTQPPPSSASVFSGSTYYNNNLPFEQPPFLSPSASTFASASPAVFMSAPSPTPTCNSSQSLPYQQYQQQVAQYEILNKYNAPPAPAPTYNAQEQQESSNALVPFTPAKLTMEPVNPFDAYGYSAQQSNDLSDQDKLLMAMKKLVNFDNIRDESEAKQMEKLSSKASSMNLRDSKASQKSFAPITSSYVNSNASLAEIQASKGGKQQVRPSVMSAPPQAASPATYSGYPPIAGGTTSSYGAPPTGYHQFQQTQQVPQVTYNNYQFAP